MSSHLDLLRINKIISLMTNLIKISEVKAKSDRILTCSLSKQLNLSLTKANMKVKILTTNVL